MNAQLIYVVGPSGAGKDSLLHWLRAHLPAHWPLTWARRTIDRPCAPQGEVHESVNKSEFDLLLAQHEFALHWAANAHQYGIRHTELAPLAEQQWVFLNGSRAHLPQAAQLYPGLTVLHITADFAVLRKRLQERGRESSAAIENRLGRTLDLSVPAGCRWIEIHNNEGIEGSGAQLLKSLSSLAHWPQPLTGSGNPS